MPLSQTAQANGKQIHTLLHRSTPLTSHRLWVKPRRGCAIINLGDAAVKFTNGVLCSGRHRVIPSPGMQGTFPRYSVVYFVRPEDAVMLRTLDSATGAIPADTSGEPALNAKDWIFQQAQGLGVKNLEGK